VAPRDRALDRLAIVRRSRNDGDASLERVELTDALIPAHADHRIAPIQRVLHHVAPELAGRTDDAHLHRLLLFAPTRRVVAQLIGASICRRHDRILLPGRPCRRRARARACPPMPTAPAVRARAAPRSVAAAPLPSGGSSFRAATPAARRSPPGTTPGSAAPHP